MARKSAEDKELDILEEVNKNINAWYGFYDENNSAFRDDENFLFVSQWSKKDIAEFRRLQKPMLTFNKIFDFFNKAAGEQRQNSSNVKVRCINGDASQDAITLRADAARHIEYESRASIVYNTALEHALAGGYGAMRVETEYEGSKSFNQKIKLVREDNPTRCFFDPNAKELTKFDGDFCGHYNVMSKKSFKNKYAGIDIPESYPLYDRNNNFSWFTKDDVTIVYYYRKEYYSFTLYKLSDGREVTDKEYRKIIKKFNMQNQEDSDSESDDDDFNTIAAFGDSQPEGLIPPEIISSMKSKSWKIVCYVCMKNKILEKYDWPSLYFPNIFCPGNIRNVDGKEITISFIRFSKDAQRFLNYTGSEIAQSIKNSRREQFIGTPDNVSGEGILEMWLNPSVQQGILIANPDPVTKQLPQKIPASEIPQTLLLQYKQLENDIQTILGLYEANRGAEGQELSGRAIEERKKTGNMSLVVFFDNLDSAIAQAWRVVISLLPSIYDTEREVPLRKEDGTTKSVTVNQRVAGGKILNDITSGEYDVAIEAGPSFAVQRQDALQMLMQLVSINPQIFPLVSDLIAKNINIENMPQLVERLSTLVPQDIIAKEKGLTPPPPPPTPPPDPSIMIEMQKLQFQQDELNYKKQQQQIDLIKALQQQKIDAGRVENEAQQLMFDQHVAGVKASAEVEKAKMENQAAVIDSMGKIMQASANVTKHNHEALAKLSEIDRQQ